VRLPAILAETGPRAGRVRRRRTSSPSGMRPMLVVVLLELDEFPFEISGGPEQRAIL
jgi:hypothetical protein